MFKIFSLIIIVGLIVGACAGKDPFGDDSNPPLKPNLIEHLGDTGDIVNDDQGFIIDTLNYHATDGRENNGIDAVPAPPSSEKIKIQWELLLDSDIDYIKIFRIRLEDIYNGNNASLLDSISSPNIVEFTDDFELVSPTNIDWFYYMKVFDTSGNSSISDTVCYRVIESPALNIPLSGITVTNIYDVIFDWGYDETVVSYRILFFDENYNLLWKYDLASNEEMPLNYPPDAPNLAPQTIYWRVDAFGQIQDEEINGKIYTIYSGSESELRTLDIQ